MTNLSIFFLAVLVSIGFHDATLLQDISTTTETPTTTLVPDNEHDDQTVMVEGIDISKLPDEYLEEFMNALDEKFIGEIDLLVGKQELLERNVLSVPRRQKRWVPLAIRGGMLAFKAGRALFRAAKRYKMTRGAKGKLTKQYQRGGDFRKAVSDFHRLKPSNVKRFRNPKDGTHGLSGKLGKYKVQVRNGSTDGRPTLELYKANKADRKIIRKVRYGRKN